MVRQRRKPPVDRRTVARRRTGVAAALVAAGAIVVIVASSSRDEPHGDQSPTATVDADGRTVGADGETVDDGVIEVTGPQQNSDQTDALQAVLDAWGDARGLSVNFVADADWEANIQRRVERDDPPDISFFPQGDVFAALAQDGAIVALSGEALASVDNWAETWSAAGIVDETRYGVPVEADVNSLVWYQPRAFSDAGYDVPTTFDEFTGLVESIAAADGPKALCVGIQSGQSTGWVYAEWVADMVLGQHGPETYDRWLANEIPFDDDRIVDSMQVVLDIWSDDNVYASAGTIEATPFQDNGQPLVDGSCFMHRQASFFSIFLPSGTPFADGSPAAVDVFAFPNNDGAPSALGSATLAAGFSDDADVQALLAYLATPDYAEARHAAHRELGLPQDESSGFLSAAIGQDLSAYDPLDRRFTEILENVMTVRLDPNRALQPGLAETFWTEGAAAVEGLQTASQAARAIDASWHEE